jgi:hypothetical protein
VTQISSDGNCELETLSLPDFPALEVGREEFDGLTAVSVEPAAGTVVVPAVVVEVVTGETVVQIVVTSGEVAGIAVVVVPVSLAGVEIDSCLLLTLDRLRSLSEFYRVSWEWDEKRQ